MAVEAGKAYVELVPRLDPTFGRDTAAQLERAVTPVLDRVAQRFSRIGDRLMGFGRSMSMRVTLPLLAAGAAAFKFASDLDEATNKARTVFGAAFGQISAIAENAATSMGLSEAKALDAMGTFGNLFTAMGLGEQPAADMSAQLVQLAADLSSFNNVPIEETLDGLRSGLVGEIEPLRRFGVNLTQVRIEGEAMRLGLVAQGEEMTSAARAQAVLSLVMADTTTAQGDFARTADGAANRTRILRARLEDLAADIGTRLLPVGERLMDFADRLITRFDTLSDSSKGITIGFGGALAVAGPLAFALGGLFKILGFTATGLQGIWLASVAAGQGLAFVAVNLSRLAIPSSIAGLANLARFIAMAGAGLAFLGKAIGVLLSPIAILMGTIELVVIPLVAFAAFLATIVAIPALIAYGLYRLIDALVGAAPAIADFFMGLPGRIIEFLSSALPQLLVMGGRLVTAIVDGALYSVGFLIGLGLRLIYELVSGAVQALPALVGFFQSLPGVILSLFATVGSWLLQVGVTLLGGLVAGVVWGAQALWAFLMALPGRVVSFFANAPAWLVSAGRSTMHGLRVGFDVGVGAVWDFIRSLPNRVIGFFISAGSWLVSAGRAVVDGLKNGIRAAWDGLIGWLGDRVDSLIGGVMDGLGMGSPSKVFEGIGRDVMAGWALGLRHGQAEADRAFGAIVPNALSAATSPLAAGGSPALAAAVAAPASSPALEDLATVGSGMTVNFNGRVDRPAVVTEELDWLFKTSGQG